MLPAVRPARRSLIHRPSATRFVCERQRGKSHGSADESVCQSASSAATVISVASVGGVKTRSPWTWPARRRSSAAARRGLDQRPGDRSPRPGRAGRASRPWPATWRRGCRPGRRRRRRAGRGRRRPRGRRRRGRATRRGGPSPSCHHDQTSSVTYGRNGASSRSTVCSAHASAARGRGRGRVGLVVRALLDQLEVVVAELPEELLGDLEGGGVVVGLERRRSRARQVVSSRASRARSTGLGDQRRVGVGGADRAEHELGGVEHLHRQPPADLHLRLVERRVQRPGGRWRRASGRRRRRTGPGCRSGTNALPLDFDIFLRSGSTMKPEIIACVHGTTPFSKCARTTRENSQVRMMSWAWVHRSIGKTRANRSSSVQPAAGDLRA